MNQSVEQQDCHFLDGCWKNNLAIHLSVLCLVLAFIIFSINCGNYEAKSKLYNKQEQSDVTVPVPAVTDVF